ncbi:FAD synthase [Mycoplasmopsis alligatoris]|uniref:FAD synthase n=1 Tax=Mycoplasmopsis alligatoris A21JP2 TaxID=747682 RepID=D4XWW1_9BACT|nr:riboflavin kinase [Mycoplasmopsis alligatoris]EFF41185.1 riboflavin kinase [Mycoplasmopsis alligatoris A21JP2]
MLFKNHEPFYVYDIENFSAQDNDVFIMGAFESLHLGHYELFKKANNDFSTQRKILVYFNNSEQMTKFNSTFFTSQKIRDKWISKIGFDSAISIDYSQIKNLEGKNFIDLIANSKKTTFIVGDDFKFGFKAKNTWKDISKFNPIYSVISVPILKVNNTKISTSKLKEFIEFGDIEELNDLLLFKYTFSSTVKINKEIILNENIQKLHSGVYIIRILYNQMLYYGLLHVTFNKEYFLDFIDFNLELKDNILVEIIVEKQLRLTISQNNDQITLQDREICKNYFLQNT